MAFPRQRTLAIGAVLLLGALAAGSLLALRAAALAHDRRVERSTRSLIDVERLSAAVSRKSAATRGYLLSGEPRLLSEVDGARAAFAEALAQLRQAAGAGEPELLEAMAQAERAHQLNFERLAALRRDGSRLGDVARLFQQETLPLRRTLDDSIERYRQAKEREIANARQAAQRGTLAVQALLVLVAVAALTSLVVVLLRLYRAIGQIERVAADWRMTFDAVDSLVVILSRDGRILRLNRAAAADLERPIAELVGVSLGELPSGEPWRTAARLLSDGRSSDNQRVRDAASGRSWDLALASVAERAILLARDITPIAALEDSLHRSETLSAMGSLVAGVAHEVRNPLFGVSATLDAFEARFGQQPGYQNYFKVLRDELARLGSLMGELLDYGRPRDLERTPTALLDIIGQAIAACQPLAERAGVALSASLPSELPTVSVDRARARQVFQNLIENAIQHSPRDSAVELEAVPQGSGVTFCVLDRGPGFREEDLPRIFEPFFTRRRGGTGLGLSIAKQLVEQHGWAISAANRQGGGAAFTLQIPVLSGQDRG